MFNSIAFTVIDAVQTGKKQFVNQFVKHEKLSNTMNDYIDTQTQYTKDFVKSVIDFGTEVYGVVTTPKFAQEITEVYGLDKFAPLAKAASKKSK